MLSLQSEIPIEKVKNLFCNETGFQTPKLDFKKKKEGGKKKKRKKKKNFSLFCELRVKGGFGGIKKKKKKMEKG